MLQNTRVSPYDHRCGLYRFVDPKGELRADGTKLLKRKGQSISS
jgi:hypothetical protein